MKKRLFLALPLDDKSRKTFLQLQNRIKAEGIRWVPEQNLHITVLFLGEQSEELLPVIIAELDKLSMESTAFDLEFDRYEIRCKRSQPAMIWARYREQQAFSNLVKRAHDLLSRWIPIAGSRPRQIPHITLARIKNREKKLTLPSDVSHPKILAVSEIILFESVLGGKDPVYTSLEYFPLLN